MQMSARTQGIGMKMGDIRNRSSFLDQDWWRVVPERHLAESDVSDAVMATNKNVDGRNLSIGGRREVKHEGGGEDRMG